LSFYSAYARVTPNSGQLWQGIQLVQQTNECNNNKKNSQILKTNLIFAEEKTWSIITRYNVFPTSLAVLFFGWVNERLIFSLPYSLLLDYSVLGSLPYPTLPEIEKPLLFRAWW